MKCIHCQGRLRKDSVPFHIDRKGCHVTLDHVPAWVCEQCGEPLLEETAVAAIQDIIRSLEEKCGAFQVPA
ncbi:MAG: YgiT-type zinc finger protein [Phycisphaerae bacterium]|nr:YgiT-type zinc finger protein [Phycisphaerae bacterium]